MKRIGHMMGMITISSLLVGCMDGDEFIVSKSRQHDFGDNDPAVIVAMGDSITAGGWSGGPSWPARLSEMTGKTVHNAGVRRAQSSDGAARIQSLLQRHRPGYVLIFYGANDAIMGIPLSITENSLRAMVAAAKENKSIPILATVMPMAGARKVFMPRINAINERIEAIAKSEGVKLVQTHRAVLRDPELYLADGLHLNNAGELLITFEFADAL